MSALENLTPFGHGTAFAYGLDDRAYIVHCLGARFRLPQPGRVHERPLELVEQLPPPMADRHWGDPGMTSLRYPSQGLVARPGAEVYVHGSAHAPREQRVTIMRVEVQVGLCFKAVQVTGTRVWRRSALGLRPSSPEPFTRIPLRYEHSFGGTVRGVNGEVVAQEPRNPIGTGVFAGAADAVDKPLPNIEDPGEPVETWNARVTPAGFGPIPVNWRPRLDFAGTYDQAWIAERAPLWPRDLDPRFFCATAPGLSSPVPFVGGEQVRLEGFNPRGTFRFALPAYRVIAKHTYTDCEFRRPLVGDGVLIETDDQTLTMFWRCAVPLGEGLRRLLRTTLRLLEPWEDPVV